MGPFRFEQVVGKSSEGNTERALSGVYVFRFAELPVFTPIFSAQALLLVRHRILNVVGLPASEQLDLTYPV